MILYRSLLALNFLSEGISACSRPCLESTIFSIETFESWVSSSGYELYETWLKNSASLTQDSAHGQELVDDASAKDIKIFRETVRLIL